MVIKRMLLLLSAMAALFAFAAPAAQADSWWTDEDENMLGEGTDDDTTVTGEGEWSTTRGFKTGPAVITAHGSLWNDTYEIDGHQYIHGAGGIATLTIHGPISTTLPGCQTSEATNSTEEGAIWPITLTTDQKVRISNVTFTNHYSAGCTVFGVPPTVPIDGTIEGDYNNETGCMKFNEAGGLTVEGAGIPVALDCEICIDDYEDGEKFEADSRDTHQTTTET